MNKPFPLAIALAAALVLPSFAVFAASVLLNVKGNNVNLRAAPRLESEQVGQVSRGDTLVLKGDINDAWVQVAPPDSVSLWVFANYVKDGKVTASSLQARSGAGQNYSVVGRLERDAEVTVRRRVGDWLEIAPFPEASLWVTNAFVEVKSPARPVPPPQPAPVADSRALAPPSPATTTPPPSLEGSRPREPQTPAPPVIARSEATKLAERAIPPSQVTPTPTASSTAGRRTLFGGSTTTNADELIGPAKIPASRLRRDVEQATSKGSRSGTLASSPAGTHPTKHRVIGTDGKTTAYILGNSAQLESLIGGQFTFEGALYWYNGTDLPTIYAQEITRLRTR